MFNRLKEYRFCALKMFLSSVFAKSVTVTSYMNLTGNFIAINNANIYTF